MSAFNTTLLNKFNLILTNNQSESELIYEASVQLVFLFLLKVNHLTDSQTNKLFKDCEIKNIFLNLTSLQPNSSPINNRACKWFSNLVIFREKILKLFDKS